MLEHNAWTPPKRTVVSARQVALSASEMRRNVEAPDVDVVIATRGERSTLLQEAVDSVYAQDYPGTLALVVVYDCDDKPSAPVTLPDAPGRRGSWVMNTRPHGLAYARNRGAREGSAALLAFLDDDDLWAPGKIRAQVAFLTNFPQVPLVGTGVTILHENGSKSPRPGPAEIIRHQDLLRSRIAELHPSSFLLRRAAFNQAGGVDEQLPGAYAEDYDLALTLSRHADLGMVTEPLTFVRWTGASYFFSRWQTIASALRHLLDKHDDFQQNRRGSARILGQIAFAEAAMGKRRDCVRTVIEAARIYPFEPRLALAALVALGVSADRIQRALHTRGRGV